VPHRSGERERGPDGQGHRSGPVPRAPLRPPSPNPPGLPAEPEEAQREDHEQDRELRASRRSNDACTAGSSYAPPARPFQRPRDQPQGERRERIGERLLDEERRVRERGHGHRRSRRSERVPLRDDHPREPVHGEDRRRHREDEDELRRGPGSRHGAEPPGGSQHVGDERREAVRLATARRLSRLCDRPRELRELELVREDRRNRATGSLPCVERREAEVDGQQWHRRKEAREEVRARLPAHRGWSAHVRIASTGSTDSGASST
jgi:hypothetical protein